MQVEVPIFQDLPRLPAPLGALYYTQVSLAVPLTSSISTKIYRAKLARVS